MLLKVGADNWRTYGSVFGRQEIIRLMFGHDVIVLGLTDGVMCASTVVSYYLQLLVANGYIRWNRSGWLIQNVWQAIYLGLTVNWTLYRDWQWPMTIFIVLHCLAMLMKQHSYAFYNGYRESAVLDSWYTY